MQKLPWRKSSAWQSMARIKKYQVHLLTVGKMYAIMYAQEVIEVLNTNITNFRKNIYGMLEQTIKYNEPVNVSTKDGNAVVISEDDYNSLVESLYLSSIPQVRTEIVEGLNTPLSECLPESEVSW